MNLGQVGSNLQKVKIRSTSHTIHKIKLQVLQEIRDLFLLCCREMLSKYNSKSWVNKRKKIYKFDYIKIWGTTD